MQKAVPSVGRILVMVLFALSCFGLLLFLWLSFGGPTPFKPKAYRFQVAVPEATQLGLEADVRVAGVPVGKVRQKELDEKGNRTLAIVELERRFAPLRSDARVTLRQKTLLGETYMEITPGTKGAPLLKENGRLPDARVQETVELDEILQALDPVTRKSFRVWQQQLAKAINGRGKDLNDVLGNLPGFAKDTSDVLEVLDTQKAAVRRLVRNTGTVFGALTEREDQLRNLIVNSNQVFQTTAAQNDSLAETFQIFPTFLRESRATFARLERFSTDTRPLIRDLRPVARDLRPTLRATRAFAPDLRRLFRDLDPLISASRTGLPALRDVLRGARPLLGELQPFLEQLNPILQFLELHQHDVADFVGNPANALYDTTFSRSGGVGSYLRQIGPEGAEAVAIYRERLSTNRGNTYPPQHYTVGRVPAQYTIFGNFDCKPSGGPRQPSPGPPGVPGCVVMRHGPFKGKNFAFPHVEADDYSKP